MIASNGRVRPLAAPDRPYYAPPNKIDELHKWRYGEYADDRKSRPWSTHELAWYESVRAENLARQQALYERSVAMNGPPTQVMPEPLVRP